MADEEFQNRVNRISARHETEQTLRPSRRRRSGALGKGSRGRYAFSLFGALASGFLTVILVRYVRFHLTGEGNVADVMAFLLDAGISIMACIAIKEMFKLHEPEFKAAQGIGVFAMVMGMHNLVFWAPQAMETLFSPTWVKEQRQDTTPNSLWVGVQYIRIGPEQQTVTAPEQPAVVYRN
ncbi:hypothetical protein KMP13_00475 [Epibacterium ulvae]|uniref:hypothetical protein n=1 Tax=Epibacterium ulvae TaxID=1156985 RepID=UPI001BFCC195|nr:hypothetical protein [Epibacterium ulvae]MBT8152395.1 hypothetical protein [Epibacterium ulvae]